MANDTAVRFFGVDGVRHLICLFTHLRRFCRVIVLVFLQLGGRRGLSLVR